MEFLLSERHACLHRRHKIYFLDVVIITIERLSKLRRKQLVLADLVERREWHLKKRNPEILNILERIGLI